MSNEITKNCETEWDVKGKKDKMEDKKRRGNGNCGRTEQFFRVEWQKNPKETEMAGRTSGQFEVIKTELNSFLP